MCASLPACRRGLPPSLARRAAVRAEEARSSIEIEFTGVSRTMSKIEHLRVCLRAICISYSAIFIYLYLLSIFKNSCGFF